MEDVTRKRVLRKLEALPEEQLYQVLDFIEFVETKYAERAARRPDPFQRFAERVEDQMRVRSLAPKAMKGTMRIMSTASRVLDGMRDLGRDLWTGPAAGDAPAGAAGSAMPPARPPGPTEGGAPEPPPGTAPGADPPGGNGSRSDE